VVPTKHRIVLAAFLTAALAIAVFLTLFYFVPKEKIVLGDDSWSMPGGNPAHTAYLPTAPSGPLQEKWDTRLEGELIGQAAVSQDRVYAGCEGGFLYCLELETGHPIWKYDADGQISAMPALCSDGILLSTMDGRVLKIGPGGDLKWQAEVGGAVRSTAIPSSDKAYFGSEDGHLYCVSLKDGSILWSFASEGSIEVSPCIYEGQVYGISYEGDLFALGAEDGRLEWTFQSQAVAASFPCADSGNIYLATEFTIDCIDSQSGKVLWHQETGPTTLANLALRGNQVLAAKEGNPQEITLLAMDARTGDSLWGRSDKESIDRTSITASNENLYFASPAHIRAVAVENGTPSLDRALDGILPESLTVTQAVVLVGTDNHKLYCLGQ
jgi:outer membrane protein assembly factor BamB